MDRLADFWRAIGLFHIYDSITKKLTGSEALPNKTEASYEDIAEIPNDSITLHQVSDATLYYAQYIG